MDTFTKTVQDVELTFRAEKYGADEQKVFVQFEFEGDGFQNAEVLPKGIEVTEEHPVIAKLTEWAETIISDRVATKKRQEEEAKAEEEGEVNG